MLAGFALRLLHVIDKQPVFHTPAVVSVRVGETPTGEVLAIEELDGLAELHLAQVRGGRHWGRAGR